MARTVKDLLEREPTDNLRAYIEYFMAEVDAAGYHFPSEAQREAFAHGALVGLRAYKGYQEAKETSSRSQRAKALEEAKAAEAAKAAAPKPGPTKAARSRNRSRKAAAA